MIRLLCRLFIKDYQNTKDFKVRENYGKLAGIVGIISNAALCAGKMAAGYFSGSIAIIADSINNLTDASSSLITLIGFRLSALPEDKEHPYGHARFEYISGIVVAMLVVLAGVELIKSSVSKIFNPGSVDVSILVIVILALSVLVKIWLAFFNIRLGKKIDSMTLAAAGADSRNDVISTSAVLAGLLITKFTALQLDGYIGALVAIFIIISGAGLVKETVSPLLGEAPDPGLVKQIRDIALSYDKVTGIHDLIVHNYGPGKIFASIHIEVDGHDDLFESHDMIDNIEKQISGELHIEVTAHLDPIDTKDPLVKQMYAVAGETAETLPGVRSIHDLRVVPGATHTNIIFDAVIGPECKYSRDEIHRIFEEKIKGADRRYRVVINFDKAYADEG